MKITYLIGNGFDISMGLNTSYSNFYDFIKENKTQEEIEANCLYRNINKNIDLWRDFEVSMGLYTFINSDEFNTKIENAEKKVKETMMTSKKEIFNSAEFDLSFDEFNNDFINYIESEEQKFINTFSENVGIKMINGLGDFSANLTNSWKKNINEVIEKIDNTRNRALEIDIINFNYTNTFESTFKNQEKLLTYIKETFNHVWGTFNETIKLSTTHIHGEIQEGSAIGVNDLTQINENTLGHDVAINYVKQNIVNTYDIKRIDRTKNIINQSDFIIFFGCSLGSTDKMWWEHVIKAMEFDRSKNIIIHDYDTKREQNPRIPKRFRQENDITKNKLMQYSPFSDEYLVSNIKDRIYPILNGNLFSRSSLQVNPFPELKNILN
ncbi:hypothetical protein EDX87_14660 [Listeria monocytogenes]|nr:hypothetical protein [Listeria monocytogenes]EAF5943937.1 hypothetical protein [Listeria monocytogenes]EAH4077091.1 hypothetical protein [Listeria monocytogenes]EAW7251440.1 hypothetical protein [Listeria monocytogenes]EDH0845547.1 hypothetical protein [Listeria monocytogenes]